MFKARGTPPPPWRSQQVMQGHWLVSHAEDIQVFPSKGAATTPSAAAAATAAQAVASDYTKVAVDQSSPGEAVQTDGVDAGSVKVNNARWGQAAYRDVQPSIQSTAQDFLRTSVEVQRLRTLLPRSNGQDFVSGSVHHSKSEASRVHSSPKASRIKKSVSSNVTSPVTPSPGSANSEFSCDSATHSMARTVQYRPGSNLTSVTGMLLARNTARSQPTPFPSTALTHVELPRRYTITPGI